MFRDSRDLSAPIMNYIFTQKGNRRYNLRQIYKFSRPLVKSVYHGSESVSFLGPKIYDLLPDDCNNIDNLITFMNKINTFSAKEKLKTAKNANDMICRHYRSIAKMPRT